MTQFYVRIAAVAAGIAHVVAVKENPLGKVLTLVDELAAKVAHEGEVEQKAYEEYVEWCDDAAKNAKFSGETAAKKKEKLETKIGELTGDIQVSTTTVDSLAKAIASAEADLAEAKSVRKAERGDFDQNEKELMEAIDTLGRAVGILEKEMSKNPALAQVDTSSMSGVIGALSTVLDATSFSTYDKKVLESFLQSHSDDADSDLAPGAPAAAVYKTQSGGILDVLEDMKEKAEGQLSELRKAETNAQHNHNMLAQSLEDQKSADTKDINQEKSNRAGAQELKATSEEELARATKDLKESDTAFETTGSACMQVAADHEATVAARKQELKVIAEAKKVLSDTSSGAVSQTYSFIQIQSHGELVEAEIVRIVKDMAKKHHSAEFAQLASQITAVAKYGTASGADPFTKIRGLIQDMIAKLEKEAGEEADEKAYCDEQMAKTEAKKEELEGDIAKMTSKIDQKVAKSTSLKEDIKVLQSELAALAKEQAEMDKIRQETGADFKVAKADLELGLSGVRKALSVLREYYANDDASFLQAAADAEQPARPVTHSKSGGAGGSIIGLLEVVEQDFAENLAKEQTQEDDAQAQYEKVTQENKITRATKDQDVKYSVQHSKSLDSEVSEISSDRQTSNSELQAVLEYYGTLRGRCIAKPETYEERTRRRAAEIEGLKTALTTLEEETAFLQRKKARKSHRGAFLAVH